MSETREDALNAAYAMLKRDGYFNDENTQLGAHYLEHNMEQIKAEMTARGYDGQSLESGGHHYLGRGAVYWVYDGQKIDYDQSRGLTDQWVKSRPI